TERNRLGIGVGVDYSLYAKDSSRNRWGLNPDSELAYDFSIGDVDVTLYERFDYSRDVESEEALRGGTAEFSRFQNTVGTFVTWRPGKWIYSLGYSHFNYLSTGETTSDQDRAAEQFIGRVGYQIQPRTVAGVEATGSLIDYTQTTRESTSYSLGPYLNWQVSEFFSASVRGGYVHYFTEETITVVVLDTNNVPIGTIRTTPNNSIGSYYVGLDLSHRLTEFISHGLTANRGIRSGVNDGGDFVVNTRIGYRIGWQFTDHLNASLRLSYDLTREPSTVANTATPDPADTLVQEVERGRFRVGFGLGWQATRRWNAGIRYEFTTRDSTEVDDDYTQNRLTINLRYRF
ncbi:MAG TPA: hypothetical protein VNO52_14390, partial [Methylomirabilota bacterium]|nr:hypothetical protein [Methylomirabilota bacterium]